VIVWDEHGGLFDHEFPPAVGHPDGFTSTTPAFAFDRLGVRVPAIVVSPYIEAGVVDHTTYEHASIPATVTEQFIGEPRTAAPFTREQFANTLIHLLTIDSADPRMDRPDFSAAAAAMPAPPVTPTDQDPATSLHIDQVNQIYEVLVRTHPIDARTFNPTLVNTESDAAAFIQRALMIIHPQ
jgi:phospholipase C